MRAILGPEMAAPILFRRLFVTCGVLLVTFSWLFRGPLLSRKTVFGPFSLLFRGFFVVPVLGKFYAYSPWNSLLIYGRLEKCVLSAGKTHVRKIPPFRGGGGLGGGECRFYFYGREDFSEKNYNFEPGNTGNPK